MSLRFTTLRGYRVGVVPNCPARFPPFGVEIGEAGAGPARIIPSEA
jgi:hypothetical protein